MSNIVLRNLERPTAVEKTVEAGYLYKDVSFDLDPTFTPSGEFQKKTDQQDLRPIFNKTAVLTSLANIFTTTPGEKLLNPRFGIDLRAFLFDPVSETRAFIIGTKIYDNITSQEPRVEVEELTVTALMDEHEYVIDFKLSIPSLNLYGISLAGVLNNDGFNINHGN